MYKKLTKAEKDYRKEVRMIKYWYSKYQEIYEGERDALYAQYMELAKMKYETKIGK